MNASEIARALNAKRHGNNYRARCPAHDDKHPSLWFSDTGGKLHFQCKAGCDYRDIRAALGLHGRINIDSLPPIEDPLGESVRRRKITRTWENAKPVIDRSSPVWQYLVRTRKVLQPEQLIPSVLREANLKYFDCDGKHVGTFPAMVARLDRPNGNIATLHRTYISENGSRAPVEPAKKLMPSPMAGCTEGSAIRLFAPTNGILGIAEGIETALACFTLFDIPTWAAWSSIGLAKFVVPAEITDLIIFADNDAAGVKASNELIEKMRTKYPDLRIRLQLPQLKGHDFADELFGRS
jgi:putative DNA primase/helicase